MADSTIKRYYDALGEGKLLGKKCGQCGAITFPPTTACNDCGSFEQSWTELSGKGKLLFVSHGMAPRIGGGWASQEHYRGSLALGIQRPGSFQPRL